MKRIVLVLGTVLSLSQQLEGISQSQVKGSILNKINTNQEGSCCEIELIASMSALKDTILTNPGAYPYLVHKDHFPPHEDIRESFRETNPEGVIISLSELFS